jgi:hypothetical protein
MIFIWGISLFVFLYWVGPIIDRFKNEEYMNFLTLYLTAMIVFWKYLTVPEAGFFLQLGILYYYIFTCYYFNQVIEHKKDYEIEED